MPQSVPIPHGATVDDPLWTGRFYDLANSLILCGTKAKIVRWATGLTPKQVSERYLRLTGNYPPLGRNGQAEPKYFARPSKHNGPAWPLQCAIYAGCYERLKMSFEEPVHKPWLVYTAFNAYLQLTESSIALSSVKAERININVAFDLISQTQQKHPPLALHLCPDCGIRYLILTTAELDNQHCPICALQKQCDHLITTGTNAAKKRCV